MTELRSASRAAPEAPVRAELRLCPTHAVCPPCREGWGHWNGHEYVPTIQSEATRIERETGVNPLAMGCAGDD